MTEPEHATASRVPALLSALALLVVVLAAVIVVVVLRAGDEESLTPDQRTVSISTPSCGRTPGALGTAVLVGDDLAVTVAHVALTGGTVEVIHDGSTRNADVLALDLDADLALLRVDGVSTPPVGLAALDDGEAVLVIGSQSGAVVGEAVRPVDISIEQVGGTEMVERGGYELRIDLVKGDSGAGVFDEDGRLGGIVFAVSRRTAGVTWISDSAEVDALLSMERTVLRCDETLGRAVAERIGG